MGVEKVSKKDPRIIYERTRNLKTGTYYTITRPNPEYKGLTLEQAKAREKIKELEKIAYPPDNNKPWTTEDKIAVVICMIIYSLPWLIGIFLIIKFFKWVKS